MKLESEVRVYLETLRVEKPKDKAEIQRLLLIRKRENLIEHRDKLLKLQTRALTLLRRVDYTCIRPAIRFVTTKEDLALWSYYRHIVSSAPWQNRPGRAVFAFVVDESSGGVMGIMDFGSDLQSLGPRDRYIGWTRQQKFDGRGLSHLVNVGTCVAAHPFGILTGGKFMISAAMSDTITSMWQSRYGQVLAGVVTTSLYGRSSVYNRVPGLEYVGDTMGQGIFHVTPEGWTLLKQFMAENNLTDRMRGSGNKYQPKLEVIQRVCSVLKYPEEAVSSQQPRGVYVGLLGDGAAPFLRGESAEFTSPSNSESRVRDWWLDRWYAMRYPKVKDEIGVFDWTGYRVDEQIERCQRSQVEAAVRRRRAEEVLD